jgi:hypothetical protein
LAVPASGKTFKLAVTAKHSGVLQRERERSAFFLLAFSPVCTPRRARSFLLGVRRNRGRV